MRFFAFFAANFGIRVKPGKEVLYRSIFDLGRDFLKDEAFK